MAGRLRVTQTKSTISHIARNRATVRALGLKRIGDTVEIADNPATRGMVRQVRFLVSVEEVGGDSSRRADQKPAADRGDATARPSEDGEGQENQA
jgi:large subunit ribosomal protein L30